MFHEYAQFKYDIYRWRAETQAKSSNRFQNPINSVISSSSSTMAADDESIDVGEQLKYDLGTPILLYSFANKLYNMLEGTAN